jgi:ketosteroid isomerase-like protein
MTFEEELVQFGKQWDEAMINNDPSEISKFMSEDWIIVGTEGGITTKQEFLSGIVSGDLTHSVMNSDKTVIKIYDNTAIVTSRGTSAGKYKGADFEFYEWSTSVCIRRQNKWQCVHTMLTPALK